MSSLNKVCLIGRLGRDVEMRQTQKGDSVANISIATTEKWKKNGEAQEKTEWHKVVMFEKLAEIANSYLHKGSLVYIEGKLQHRTYEKDGETKYVTEVVVPKFGGVMTMLDGPKRNETDNHQATETKGTDDLSDDIPF